MKKTLLLILFLLTCVFLFGQSNERKVAKEINKFYFEATNHYYFHEYDSAILKLDILDFLYEDNANIKFFLGMSYLFKGDFEIATTYLEESITNDNVIYTLNYQNGKFTPHVVYFYLGFCYEKLGRYKDAIESYKNYIYYEKEENIIRNMNEKIDVLQLTYGYKND